MVACRQLGLPTTGATALTGADVPDGTGQIWLDDVMCLGTESRLLDCPASSLGSNSCRHEEDVGVDCASAPTPGKDKLFLWFSYNHRLYFAAPCTQGAIRLQGGTATSGRVEICNNNIWGTVCDDLWSGSDAVVACRQLGLPTTGATALTGSDVPDGAGQIWLDNVMCLGTESRLLDCPASSLGSNSCRHEEDVGVDCASAPTPGKDKLFLWFSYNRIDSILQHLAPKEPSDLKEAMPLVDVWRSATMQSGAQCVMTIGMLQMPKWSVDSWGLNPWVSACTNNYYCVWHRQCVMTTINGL